MEHERDRKVDTFGFGVDKHEDQKRGFALAEIDRKSPLNGNREASHFGRCGMGQLEEIERINQIRADLIRQRDQHVCRIESINPNSSGRRSSAHVIYREVRRLERLIAAHDRHIERLRGVLS
jgi:hypothetical protein